MSLKPPAQVAVISHRPSLTRHEWILLLVLAAIQFTHIVDFVIMMPLGASPTFNKQIQATPQEFGRLVGAYSISAGLAGIAVARFLDRFDRKWALLVPYAGFMVGTFLCALANSYSVLLAARAVAGAFGGVAAATLLATVGDAFADERRGFAMGVIMSAFSVASIVGVPTGILLAKRLDWHLPYIFLGGISVVVLVIACWVLPPLRGHMSSGQSNEVRLLRIALDRNHIRAFLLTAVLCMAFTMFTFMPTFLVANVGLTQDGLANMYMFGGLATLVTLTLVGKAADRYGKLFVFRISALTTIVVMLGITQIPAGMNTVLVLLITTCFMVATSSRMVPATALIAGSAIPAERGGFMSLNAAVQHMAISFAAWLGGWLLDRAASGGPGAEIVPLTGFWKAGVVASSATLISMWLAGRLRPAAGGELAPDEAAVADM